MGIGEGIGGTDEEQVDVDEEQADDLQSDLGDLDQAGDPPVHVEAILATPKRTSRDRRIVVTPESDELSHKPKSTPKRARKSPTASIASLNRKAPKRTPPPPPPKGSALKPQSVITGAAVVRVTNKSASRMNISSVADIVSMEDVAPMGTGDYLP